MITQTTPALQSPQAKNKILSTDRCLSVIFHDSNCPPPFQVKALGWFCGLGLYMLPPLI